MSRRRLPLSRKNAVLKLLYLLVSKRKFYMDALEANERRRMGQHRRFDPDARDREMDSKFCIEVLQHVRGASRTSHLNTALFSDVIFTGRARSDQVHNGMFIGPFWKLTNKGHHRDGLRNRTACW
jgi:hypothetical protein